MAARLEAVHPVLVTLDVPGAVAFYKKIGFALAFQDNADDPRYVVVKRDTVVMHLQWHHASELIVGADRPNYRLQVEDVDAFYEEFLSSGAINH